VAISYTTASSFIKNIDEAFPIANKDNSSQGFRDNFKNIRTALSFIDNDASILTNNLVSLTNLLTDFKNNLIKNFVLEDSGVLIYDDTATLQTGDIVVNVDSGNYQKFTVSSGTHWLSFINWPKNSLASTVIVSVSTITNDQTFINFDFDLSGENTTLVNYGRDEFPIELKGEGPFLFKITNNGLDDVLYIKEYNQNNRFTSPLVLPNYTRNTLKSINESVNGSFAFLKDGFNTPVYFNNGSWYSMFNNQIVILNDVVPEGPQGPVGNVVESINITVLNSSTSLVSGQPLSLEFKYLTDTTSTLVRSVSWTIVGSTGFSASGSKNIILENNSIATATQILNQVGQYTVNVSVIGQNGITLTDSDNSVTVSSVNPGSNPIELSTLLTISNDIEVDINQTYVGGISGNAPRYASLSGGAAEISGVFLNNGVLPAGMSPIIEADITGKFTDSRLVGTPTTVGVFIGTVEVTFNDITLVNVSTTTNSIFVEKEIRVVPFPATNAILPCSQTRTVTQNQLYTQLGYQVWQSPLFAHGFNGISLTAITLVSGTIPPGMFLARQIINNDNGQPIHKAGLVGTPTTPGSYTLTVDVTSDSAPTIQVTKTITVV